MRKKICSTSVCHLLPDACRWWAFVGLGALLMACSSDEPMGEVGGRVLTPAFYTGEAPVTRSIVNGIGTDPASADQISKIKMYVTLNSNTSVYPGITGGTSVFTFDGTAWQGTPTVKLYNETARIFAFYPVYQPGGSAEIAVTPAASGSDTHTVPASVPATQTFNAKNAWECSVADYMYGSKQGTLGDATPVVASNSNGNYSPAIYMQHALAQVVFQLQTKSGRPVDATYDYVKQITLKAQTTSPFLAGTSARMQLKDGALSNLSAVSELVFKPSSEAEAVLCGASNNPVMVAYGLVAPIRTAPGDVSLVILLGKRGDTQHERRLTVAGNTKLNIAWEKGKKYVYNLILTDRAIELKEAGIKGWDEVTGSQTVKPEGY